VSSHLLQEVEQTVDDVVIIANGVLVKQGTMTELRGGGGTLVRTSDPARLAGALDARGVASSPTDDGALLAATSELRLVGEAAHHAGLPVWELTSRAADLEALFLALTAGGNRNLGEHTPADTEGAA